METRSNLVRVVEVKRSDRPDVVHVHGWTPCHAGFELGFKVSNQLFC